MDAIEIQPEYSVLKEDDLLEKIVPLFNISDVQNCKTYYEGANDSYKIFTSKENYLLRIYTIIPIRAPEGIRYAIMTTFAEGEEFWDGNDETWRQYAKNVADIHNKSDDFVTTKKRFALDKQHLLYDALHQIRPYLENQHEELDYIESIVTDLSSKFEQLSKKEFDYGFCHGDFHGGNAHQNGTDMVFFDFDCCGYGYRAYDLAVFKWCAQLNNAQERWTPFIEEYKKHRSISEADINAVDLFVAIRHIWLMGFHLNSTKSIGVFGRDYFNNAIQFLKKCEENLTELRQN
jgi:Ser/Thr protein kinase RdoA (MazF antagonist)